MGLKVITPAAAAPVSLAEAKEFCYVDGDLDDAVLTSLIDAVTEHAQAITRRQFVTAAFELTLDRFVDTLPLVPSPLVAVQSMKYIDADGVEQTLDASYYTVDDTVEPAVIHLNAGMTYPDTKDVKNAVMVSFTSGYGVAADVPQGIRTYIKVMVNTVNENREAGKDIKDYPFMDSLLSRYRVFTF